MSDTGWAGFLAEQGIGGPTDYYAHGALLAQRKAVADDRAAEREELRRQAQLEEARDQRMVSYHLAGVQPGAKIQRALALQDTEAEIAAHQAEIDKLTRRRTRMLAEARQQDEAMSRSAAIANGPAPRDGIEGAVQRARSAARELQAEARIEAVRAEGQFCPDCAAAGASEEESWMIHHDPLPLPVPSGPLPPVPDYAEQRAATGYEQEITRLVSQGFSRETAELAMIPAGRVR
jgi:hypothetical protein